jgi:hypothetical protein
VGAVLAVSLRTHKVVGYDMLRGDLVSTGTTYYVTPDQAQRRDELQFNNIPAEPVLITRSWVTPHSAARSQPMYCHSN